MSISACERYFPPVTKLLIIFIGILPNFSHKLIHASLSAHLLPLHTVSPNTIVRRSTDPLPRNQDPRITTTLPRNHEFAMADIEISKTQKEYKGTRKFGIQAVKTMQKGFDVVNDVAQDIHMLGGL